MEKILRQTFFHGHQRGPSISNEGEFLHLYECKYDMFKYLAHTIMITPLRVAHTESQGSAYETRYGHLIV